nr:protein phosphatase 2C domain-containing protein [Methylobacterium nodulans]
MREINEDRCFSAPERGIFAVADGMGGHAAGEVASAAIVGALASIGQAVSAADLLARLEDRMLRANAAVHALAQERGTTIGSTLAALLTFEPHFACIWSGDSRVYLVRDRAIAPLSRDHTEARALVEEGVLSPEEARTWPRRNVITRAIGVRPEPELECEAGELRPGDRFVLCSDGLTGHVEDTEILAHALAEDPQAACDRLVALTLERGARDNVTVVVVRYEPGARPALA